MPGPNGPGRIHAMLRHASLHERMLLVHAGQCVTGLPPQDDERRGAARVVLAVHCRGERQLLRAPDRRQSRRIALRDPFALRLAKASVNETMDIQGQRRALEAAFKNYMLTIPHRQALGTHGEAARSKGVRERLRSRDAKFEDADSVRASHRLVDRHGTRTVFS